MSEAAKRFLESYGEWVRTGVILAAMALLAVVDTRYVSRVEYSADKKSSEASSEALRLSMESVRVSIVLQEQQLRTLNESESKLLNDHESRLRALEFSGRRQASN